MPHSQALPRPIAILILLICATLFASNHVAAKIAFSEGSGLLLAVTARAALALLFMLVIANRHKAPFHIPKDLRKWQLLLGLLIAAQSLCLYTAITIIPVPMALLLVNTWPMLFILANWMSGKQPPRLSTFLILCVILVGLFFVLDISTDEPITQKWILGVGLAMGSSVFLAISMWLTQYQLASLPGSVRSSYTMLTVVASILMVGSINVIPNGFALPNTLDGYLALTALAVFYGIAITLLFVLASRLNMAINSPMLNFEPVASLLLSALFLGQFLNQMQLIGGAIVVAGIMTIGLKRQT